MDPPLGFVEKLRVVLACAVAILLLRTLGWQVAHPADAQMALTLSRSGASVLALWPTLAVLSAVSAAIGTAIIGRRLPDAGVFAAAIGVAAMSLRGGTMQILLGYHAGTQPETRRALMLSLAIDCILWTSIMAVAWITTVIVRKWLWASASEPVAEVSPPPAAKPAAAGGPKAATGRKRAGSTLLAGQTADYLAFAITLFIALIVIWNTVSRTPVAMVERNQVIASVAGGLYLGALAARYFTGGTHTLWYALAAPVVGLIGFILGHLSGDMAWAQGTPYQPYVLLATTPPHDLVRPLPVLYVTVGIAGALGGFWTADRMERLAQQESA